jgi:hypothetical protein
MFGLFKNIKSKLAKSELESTLKNADRLEQNDRFLIAYRIANQMATFMQQLKGLPVPSNEVDIILKSQLKEVATRRRSTITSLGEKNPQWVEATLLESFLVGLSGIFGKKVSDEMILLIMSWLKKNMSEKEFRKIFDKI